MDSVKALASSTKGFFDIVGSKVYPDIYVPPKDLTGKRVLVTGGNSGIGKETALTLASWGAEVHLLCRDPKRAEAARAEIVEQTNNSLVFVEIVDFASLASEREFVRRWAQRPADERKIDILVSNAGVACSSKVYTEDGFEIHHQVNSLSHYALVVPLIQLGLIAPDCRIILVASSGIYSSKKLDPEDLNSEDILGTYKIGDLTGFEKLWSLSGRSKAEQVIFGRELQARLSATEKWKDVTVSTCHPGAVATPIWEKPSGLAYNPVMARWAKSMIDTVGISVQQGATTPIFLASSDDAVKPDVRGKYWERCGWKWTPAWMEDADLRTALWKKWEEETKVQCTI
ncbi:hypothetical protein M407DRAFT_244398 [Tulasnella calospora MUT 4182]|uniref:Uncharacterized protein n=1 Tax=Tulasnella calospora MUT 4182 TaxID=1051891 RepID=A0A0C3QGD0_9AGAM|nr:hypothetical protein M407DRAFT_244398 [Tulasnella calospora MUT 4182]